MGVLSTVVDVFRSKTLVSIDASPAAGSAQDSTRTLMIRIRESKPGDIRKTRPGHFEFVIQTDRLDEYCDLLEAVFGEPCKPFGMHARFNPELASCIASIGGIMKNQCLYLRRFADDHVAYAALWPWGDPSAMTLKLGVFEESLPI